jgi:hypothetical protein
VQVFYQKIAAPWCIPEQGSNILARLRINAAPLGRTYPATAATPLTFIGRFKRR